MTDNFWEALAEHLATEKLYPYGNTRIREAIHGIKSDIADIELSRVDFGAPSKHDELISAVDMGIEVGKKWRGNWEIEDREELAWWRQFANQFVPTISGWRLPHVGASLAGRRFGLVEL